MALLAARGLAWYLRLLMLAVGLLLAVPVGHSELLRAIGEAELKSVLAYNIMRFTSWPDSAFSDPAVPFSLCTVGNPLGGQLGLLAGKNLQGHAIALVPVSEETQLPSCHAIVFAADRALLLASLNKRLQALAPARPVLTLSDSKGFAKRGGMVELIIANDRPGFVVALPTIQQAGLGMKANLLKLATVIGDDR